MISIFICEDQDRQRDRLTKVIKDYVLMENLDMNVVLSTENPHDVISYVKKHNITDGLYFLDIDLKTDITGIELAVRIREYDRRGMIAFVTADKDSIKLTIKQHIEVLDYIEKDDIAGMEADVKKCIEDAQKRLLEDSKKRFQYKFGDEISSIPYDEILYFEKSPYNHNKVAITTTKGDVEYYDTLKNVENKNEDFYRVGASFVINMSNVERYVSSEGRVEMKNDVECIIPVRKRKEFLRALEIFEESRK